MSFYFKIGKDSFFYGKKFVGPVEIDESSYYERLIVKHGLVKCEEEVSRQHLYARGYIQITEEEHNELLPKEKEEKNTFTLLTEMYGTGEVEEPKEKEELEKITINDDDDSTITVMVPKKKYKINKTGNK